MQVVAACSRGSPNHTQHLLSCHTSELSRVGSVELRVSQQPSAQVGAGIAFRKDGYWSEGLRKARAGGAEERHFDVDAE